MRRLLALLCVPALLLAGCGGDDGDGRGGGDGPTGGPAAIVAAAIKKSEDAESYRLKFDVDSDLGGQEFSFKGQGVAAADQSRARFKGSFTQGADSFDMEVMSVGEDYYYRGGVFEELKPKDKDWLHVDDPTATTTMTPAEFVEFLRESPEIEEAGREQVRGEQAIHLSGPVDFKKLAENTSSKAVEQFKRIPQAEEMKMLIDVWVAEKDDRIMRMAIEASHPAAQGKMRMTADILEYDVSLDGVEKPAAGEVAEGKDIAGG